MFGFIAWEKKKKTETIRRWSHVQRGEGHLTDDSTKAEPMTGPDKRAGS